MHFSHGVMSVGLVGDSCKRPHHTYLHIFGWQTVEMEANLCCGGIFCLVARKQVNKDDYLISLNTSSGKDDKDCCVCVEGGRGAKEGQKCFIFFTFLCYYHFAAGMLLLVTTVLSPRSSIGMIF